jgi:Ni/Fe-hydrogenase subunit HybB-like protein
MSLMRNFISVMWGPLYFIAGWLCLLSLVAILAHRYRERHNLDDVWGKWEFHDIGKLMFAFTIFWAYIWFAQFLPIWYGNLGRETIFFEQRTENGFGTLLWLQMALVFMVPFVLLLFRRPKMDSRYLSLVGLILLVGFWLERYMLVVPSTWKGEGIPFGWPEIAITVGFMGLFGLSYSLYASLTPKLPIHEALIIGERSRGP